MKTPSPPPLPYGKGSESPSVGRGQTAPRFACVSSPLPQASGRCKGIKGAILTRSVLGLRPALRVRLPVEPLTPFPLRRAQGLVRDCEVALPTEGAGRLPGSKRSSLVCGMWLLVRR